MKTAIKYSVIISVYNEEKVIGDCLASLAGQTVAREMEVIVVDDGSTDKTQAQIKDKSSEIKDKKREEGSRMRVELIRQDHQGPGKARNLGVQKARGEILIFVDADMEFAPNFIERLVAPILLGQTIGTFSKEEYLLNKDNALARCWNLNLGRPALRLHPADYPDIQPVFRAILKSKFEEAGGFDTAVGYTDDWSLSRKLGVLATAAPAAKFYHRNPDNLCETWIQARWFGKNEFLTGNLVRRFYNLWRYCPVLAVGKGIAGAVKHNEAQFFLFKVVYDTAVFVSVCLSFAGEHKAK